MSQNTRLLLIALCVLVVFGIFLQSLIARSLQESFGDNVANPPRLPPAHPEPAKGLDGQPAIPKADTPAAFKPGGGGVSEGAKKKGK